VSDLRRRRQRRIRSTRARRATRRRALGISALCVVGAGVVAGGLAMNSVAQRLEEKQGGVKEIRLGQNTRVYDRDGNLLGVIAGTTNRTLVSSKRIPQVLKDATVAIEDKRFYDHEGVDYYRLVGAAARNATSDAGRQGGSTITMQLVKNLTPGGEDRTMSRKVEEAYLALQYEKKYTKDEILTRYLNSVFYGNNAVGVQAASLTYFSKPVWAITLPQAALLAGLPQAPSAYNPFANPEDAKTRRNQVIDQMADQGFISAEKAEQAKRAGLGLRRGDTYSRPKREGYFFEYVRQRLISDYGEREVEKGGFRVYSTVDQQLQKDAQAAIGEHLDLPDDPASAIVMVDSRTGYIRAMQSSQRYSRTSQFNFAQARRQPGSTFKTFVLTRFVEQGYNPNTVSYPSRPLNFYDPTWGQIDVSTYSNTYSGRTTVAAATLKSDNSVYTQMTLDLGPGEVVDMAYAMGIPKARDLPRYPSVGLGAGEVTPIDMATAYSPLSNGGWRVTPLGVQRIVKANGAVQPVRPSRRRAFPDGVSYEVTKILRGNVTSGTGTAANIDRAVAGKTGTTDDYVDAWFVGYTPCYTTAVWVGYPNDTGTKRSMYGVHGLTVSGGTFPARIWASFMEKVLANPRYACRYDDFQLPQDPVEWSSFSSRYTRMADTLPTTTESATEGTTTTTTEGTTTESAAPDAPAPEAPPPPPAPPPHPAPAPAPAPAPDPAPVPDPAPAPAPASAPAPAPGTP
jgi:penicillin-binding protein 1A